MDAAAQRGWREFEYNIPGVREQYPFLSIDVDGNQDLPMIIERISRVLAVRGRTKRP